jgi:hypothetical protein
MRQSKVGAPLQLPQQHAGFDPSFHGKWRRLDLPF